LWVRKLDIQLNDWMGYSHYWWEEPIILCIWHITTLFCFYFFFCLSKRWKFFFSFFLFASCMDERILDQKMFIWFVVEGVSFHIRSIWRW
jgi:hypothetical protein